jgi:Zn-dependent protease
MFLQRKFFSAETKYCVIREQKKMIQTIFQNNFSRDSFIQILMLIPIVLFSLSFHEFSHGYVAYKCGDNTAKNLGRLTMNPIKHLDPIGAIMMLLLGYGWAKPVPIITRNFKKFKRDLVLVSVAGPLSNLILAFIGTILIFLCGKIMGISLYYESGYLFYQNEMTNLQEIIIRFIYLFCVSNIGLAIFNLIPIPPLDGSRVVWTLLPHKLAVSYAKIEQYTLP